MTEVLKRLGRDGSGRKIRYKEMPTKSSPSGTVADAKTIASSSTSKKSNIPGSLAREMSCPPIKKQVIINPVLNSLPPPPPDPRSFPVPRPLFPKPLSVHLKGTPESPPGTF